MLLHVWGRANVLDNPGVHLFFHAHGIDIGFIKPRFNIPPGEPLLTLYKPQDKIEMAEMHWGIDAPWAKPGERIDLLTNARSETIWEKASFKKLIATQRCVAIVTSFYEWKREEGRPKRPFHFKLPTDGMAFAIAAIWKISNDGVLQVCLITTGPNGIMEPIYDRMPVLIAPEKVDTWITSTDKDELNSLMKPSPNNWLVTYEVSNYVNNARNDGPQCIEPI